MNTRKGYKPVFRRERRHKVSVPMMMHAAVARALKKHVKRQGYSSVGMVAERLVVLFLAADQTTRRELIRAGVYAADENHVARCIRRAGRPSSKQQHMDPHAVISTAPPDTAGYEVEVHDGPLDFDGVPVDEVLDHGGGVYRQSRKLYRLKAVQNAFAAGVKVGRRIAAEDDDNAGEEWKSLGG